MHVVIAGCGRVGSSLALSLTDKGHTVAVIDKNPAAFRRLGEDFTGTKLQGIVFDRDTLELAGVKTAQAFVAVTSGDNSNIVSARAAKEHYGVATVVARIYDPDRAHIYEKTGITTIASARWTADAVLRELLPAGERIDGSLGPGEGDVVLMTFVVPDLGHAVDVAKINVNGTIAVAAMSRGGVTTVPSAGTLLHEDDQVHLAVHRSAVDTAKKHIASLAQEH